MAPAHLLTLILALASLKLSTAAPQTLNSRATIYPEVIPGPGLPSLAELNMTSEQLYTTPLDTLDTAVLAARDSGCGPVDNAYTDAPDVVACYNYLKGLGTKRCKVGANYKDSEFCRSGSAHVLGQATTSKATSSYCRDVATAVLYTLNTCTRPDQSVAGFHAAGGNGFLTVLSVRKAYPGNQ